MHFRAAGQVQHGSAIRQSFDREGAWHGKLGGRRLQGQVRGRFGGFDGLPYTAVDGDAQAQDSSELAQIALETTEQGEKDKNPHGKIRQ